MDAVENGESAPVMTLRTSAPVTATAGATVPESTAFAPPVPSIAIAAATTASADEEAKDSVIETDKSVVVGGGEGGERRGDISKGDTDKGPKEKKEKTSTVGLGKLFFKYAKPVDILFMFLGTCFAILCG